MIPFANLELQTMKHKLIQLWLARWLNWADIKFFKNWFLFLFVFLVLPTTKDKLLDIWGLYFSQLKNVGTIHLGLSSKSDLKISK